MTVALGSSKDAAAYSSTVARRKAYLEIMRRRFRPGRGSSLSLLLSRVSYPMPDLRSLLPGVRFVVVGGTATSLYMPQRMTRDVDILVAASNAPAVERALKQAGATSLGPLAINNPLRIDGNAWKMPDGTELDVLRSSRSWVKEALAHPQLDAASLPIVSLPYLVLMKLASGRSQDMADISRMLGGADYGTLDAVRQVVRKYLPDALDDMEGLAELGRGELYSVRPANVESPGPSQSPGDAVAGRVRVREHERKGKTVREHWRKRAGK